MSLIYHIAYQNEWNEAKEKGSYETASLPREGFIHCSEESQLQGVLDRYYTGKTGLVKLTIDTELLTSKLIYEWSLSLREQFPHVYGPINIDAVKDVTEL